MLKWVWICYFSMIYLARSLFRNKQYSRPIIIVINVFGICILARAKIIPIIILIHYRSLVKWLITKNEKKTSMVSYFCILISASSHSQMTQSDEEFWTIQGFIIDYLNCQNSEGRIGNKEGRRIQWRGEN